MSHEQNCTERAFKFPNTTDSDRFNITIRAYGVAGYGNPLIINSDRWANLPIKDSQTHSNRSSSVVVIFIIILTSLAMLAFATGYVVCRRDRYCKQNGIINSSEQSSFQPPHLPLGGAMRIDEMYEMQTLIPTAQTTVMTNGKDVTTTIKLENTSNGGMNTTRENQKVLRTSTPTDDAVNQICIELPSATKSAAMRSDVSAFCFDDVEKPLSNMDFAAGILDLNFAPQPSSLTTTTTTALDIHAPPDNTIKYQKLGEASKVNGNLSPYKSLQVSCDD